METKNRSCAMVVGMHRSGTSSIAGVLAQLGYAAPEKLICANESNPKGHWEAEPIARFNDRMLTFAGSNWRSWDSMNRNWINTPYFDRFVKEGTSVIGDVFGDSPMIVLKDPRLSRLTSVWREILTTGGFDTTVFTPIRHPAEVSASLGLRNDIDAAQGQYLWLRYMLDAERGTRGDRRFMFRYSDFVADWRETLRQAEETVGVVFPCMNDVTIAFVDSFVDQSLYRNKSDDLGEAMVLHPLVAEVYEILTGWTDSGERAEDHSRIDEIDEVFSDFGKQVRPLFLTFDNIQQHLKAMEASLSRHSAGLAEVQAHAEAQAAPEHAASSNVVEAISAQVGEIDVLRATLAQMSTDLIEDGSGLRASFAKLVSSTQSENLAAVSDAKALSEAVEKETTAKIAALTSELTAMLEASDAHAKQASELRTRIETLQHEDVQVRAETERANETISELEACLSALTSELAAIREASEAQAEQASELRTTIETLRHQDAQTRAETERAKGTISELEGRLSALTSEIEQKRAEADHVYAERDALLGRVAELEAEAEDTATRERAVQRELQRSSDELLVSLGEVVSLANLLRNEEQNSAKLNSELCTEQKRRRDVEKELGERQQKAVALQHEVNTLRDELANTVRSRIDLYEKKQAADAKLIKLREDHAGLQAQAEVLEESLEKQMALTEELDSGKLLASSKLKALRKRHEDLLTKHSKLALAQKSAERRVETADSHAELASRILERMVSERLAFPSTKRRGGVLEKLPGSPLRRWQLFCHNLAEQGTFDASAYLALHPDVAEAGIDPLVHYLTRGHAERRALSLNSGKKIIATLGNGEQAVATR